MSVLLPIPPLSDNARLAHKARQLMSSMAMAVFDADSVDEAKVKAFAHLEVGNSHLGRRYQARYPKYGERYGVGAAPPSTTRIPQGAGGPGSMTSRPGGCGPGGGGGEFVASSCSAGEGRRVQYADGYSCAVRPRKCNCQVVGANTLLTAGIASAAFGPVTVDSGDADFFIPYYMFIVALQVGATPTLSTQGNPLMVLLQNSVSGREPNMRRASVTDQSFGVSTLVYGQFKDLECVDWRKFASVNNQQLTLTFYNPNEVAVHVFVNLWGIPGVN